MQFRPLDRDIRVRHQQEKEILRVEVEIAEMQTEGEMPDFLRADAEFVEFEGFLLRLIFVIQPQNALHFRVTHFLQIRRSRAEIRVIYRRLYAVAFDVHRKRNLMFFVKLANKDVFDFHIAGCANRRNRDMLHARTPTQPIAADAFVFHRDEAFGSLQLRVNFFRRAPVKIEKFDADEKGGEENDSQEFFYLRDSTSVIQRDWQGVMRQPRRMAAVA